MRTRALAREPAGSHATDTAMRSWRVSTCCRRRFSQSSRMRFPWLRGVLIPLCVSTVLAAGAAAQGGPIPLVQGHQVGRTMFEPGDTPRGGNGQPVDGIEGSSREMLKVHVHAHLAL